MRYLNYNHKVFDSLKDKSYIHDREAFRDAAIEFYKDIAINTPGKDICYQYLEKNTKTSKILDAYNESQDAILLIRDVFRTYKYQCISLLIVPYDSLVEINHSNTPTMTELKDGIGLTLDMKFYIRLLPLIEAIDEVVENKIYQNRTRIALNKPIALAGQDTPKLRTYGDTELYMIIGVEINNPC